MFLWIHFLGRLVLRFSTAATRHRRFGGWISRIAWAVIGEKKIRSNTWSLPALLFPRDDPVTNPLPTAFY